MLFFEKKILFILKKNSEVFAKIIDQSINIDQTIITVTEVLAGIFGKSLNIHVRYSK